jgi:TRAP-type mannitol/chloroaromatic compound transport system permease small subunit
MLLKRLGWIFDKVLDYTMLAAAILVVVMALAVSEETIVRKAFDFTWPPLYEIVEYLLLWITFLGAAWILRKGTHVKMDSVLGRFSPRVQALVNCITSIVGALLMGVLTYYTIKLAVHDYQTHVLLATIMNPVKWPIEMIVPIGFILLLIQSVRNANASLNTYKTLGKKEAAAPSVVPGKEQA